MNSIDPRVKRLPHVGQPGTIQRKAPLDQFGTYEVFVQPRAGKPFQHEGIVHAPNLEMAWVLAKETFTRRFTCTSLYVVDTRDVFVSPTTEGNRNAWDLIEEAENESATEESFEVYHLLKRGKQHIHAATVMAAGHRHAMARARETLDRREAVNIWAVRTAAIRFTRNEERDLWTTLPEKKFRDASDYKGGDKLKEVIDRHS